jgi:hypothetical protein
LPNFFSFMEPTTSTYKFSKNRPEVE